MTQSGLFSISQVSAARAGRRASDRRVPADRSRSARRQKRRLTRQHRRALSEKRLRRPIGRLSGERPPAGFGSCRTASWQQVMGYQQWLIWTSYLQCSSCRAVWAAQAGGDCRSPSRPPPPPPSPGGRGVASVRRPATSQCRAPQDRRTSQVRPDRRVMWVGRHWHPTGAARRGERRSADLAGVERGQLGPPRADGAK